MTSSNQCKIREFSKKNIVSQDVQFYMKEEGSLKSERAWKKESNNVKYNYTSFQWLKLNERYTMALASLSYWFIFMKWKLYKSWEIFYVDAVKELIYNSD